MSSTPMGPSTAAFFSSPHKAPPSVQPLPENQEQTRRARKGHKKSRGGCYSCKRRKIKASAQHPLSPKMMLTLSPVPRNTPSMPQLSQNTSGVCVSSRSNFSRGPNYPKLSSVFAGDPASSIHADDVQPHGSKVVPSLSVYCLSSSSTWE
jgi:hypothetical protein